jgi:hypothetical protein
MNRYVWMLLIGTTIAGMTSCSTTVKLVGTNPAEHYFKSSFGAGTLTMGASNVLMIPKKDFYDEFMADLRSYSRSDASDFPFVENGYLLLKITLDREVPVSLDQFSFFATDTSGNSLLSRNLSLSALKTRRVKNGSGYRDLTYYELQWLIRFDKAFTKANYPSGDYQLRVRYPDGQEGLYSLVPQ